ncbi:MAG: YggT family protein [Chloroflexi bacterium]|nr:YggT family protein [Chloroflexota bacterium]
MFSFLFGFVFSFIQLLSQVLTLAILARVVLSWFSPVPTNILTKMLYQITEPILAPLRRIIPKVSVFDFSPLVAVILLQLISFLLFVIMP